MNTVLITGVAGFLGRHTAREFTRLGWRVIGLDVVAPENAPPGIHYVPLALPSPALAALLRAESPQVCVHCAGRASVPLSMEDPAADFRDNTVLTFELLDALRRAAPRCRFLFLSSAAVYGNPVSLPVTETHAVAPLSPYGYHKRQGELLCEEFSRVYDLATVSVRIFSAYGAGLRRQVMWDICERALTTGALALRGTGHESRDFIHASDIARALMILAEQAPANGEVYNLATGRETTVSELAEILLGALSHAARPVFDGVIPAGTPLNWRAETGKLEALGFTPKMELERGARDFAGWCKAELT